MATITGFTAARMQEIENQAIVSGVVSGNNLMLTRKDGTQINAGNVRGLQGIQGASGEVSLAQLNDAVAALEQADSKNGLGLLRLAEVTTDQDIAGFNANVWFAVSGTTITFTPTPNRYYDFSASITASSEEAQTSFDMRIAHVGGTPSALHAGIAYAKPANKSVPINADRTLLTPAGWNSPQTFRLEVRSDSDFAYHVRASGYRTTFSITDVGKP